MEKIKVLIVEDEPIEAEEMSVFARRAGYAVIAKTNTGEAALSAISREKPDVVVFDIHLAGELDGIQTAEIVKKSWQIPVVFLTTDKEISTKARIKQIGGDYFLPKPFTEDQYRQAIEFALVDSEKMQTSPREMLALNGSFFFYQDNGYHKILVQDILYIKSEKYKSTILLANGNEFPVSLHLKKLGEKMMHPHLLRVHRSTVVNVMNVKAVLENNYLQMSNGDKIVFSQRYLPEPARVFAIVSG